MNRGENDEKLRDLVTSSVACLTDLHRHIVCELCHGYIIDPWTISECLHTFCKSCIVNHLNENNFCPNCDEIIHESHPMHYIRFDRTFQQIIFKLLPTLERDELERQVHYYESNGMKLPQTLEEEWRRCLMESTGGETSQLAMSQQPLEAGNLTTDDDLKGDLHRADISQILIQLHLMQQEENRENEDKLILMSKINGKSIVCSTHATVTQLKKLIAKLTLSDMTQHRLIDLCCEKQFFMAEGAADSHYLSSAFG
ncbi:hypothetical protein SNEBB_008550 [Seison nebaliae]|nr:hypothetical protein SNEBB_008550 [Seison nebaliae]